MAPSPVTMPFLLGPESTFITGTDLLVDGGVVAALRSTAGNRTAVI